MQLDWADYWENLLKVHKLKGVVDELNLVSNDAAVENICHSIFDCYEEHAKKLEIIRISLLQEVERLPGVHLQTSRVKGLDSLLVKIIIKKHKRMMDESDPYSTLSEINYMNVLTDLVGIRLILSYRGAWKDIHSAILQRFPLKEESDYSEDALIPLTDKEDFIAEKPRAYYAPGDDISIYEGEFIEPLLKENGYRSVHYTLCYSGVYVEIQTRTIYDEAWSDCDHSFVYKQEENESHSALKRLSGILCMYTNTSNDLGDLMKEVYDHSPVIEKDGECYFASETLISDVDCLIDKYESARKLLLQFREQLNSEGGGVVNEE